MTVAHIGSSGNVDLFTSAYWDSAAEVATLLRAEGAVHRALLPSSVPVWVVGRYEEARAALADPRLSKDAAGLSEIMLARLAEAGELVEVSGVFAPHMLFSDPPRHTRLRRLLARDFTPKRVELLRPRIERMADDLLDAMPAGEAVDLVTAFAFPLPFTVICELIGVPEADRFAFRDWVSQLMTEEPETSVAASHQMAAYFAELIAAKRAEPGHDLLSALILPEASGDRLTDPELVGTMFLLLVAGHETTANLIGNGVRWLMGDPQAWRRFGAEPGLVPAAVEELLRFDSPIRMATHRFTAEPVVIGGTAIPAGEIVLISLGSANRDERRFDRADELDLRRHTGTHLSFGHGVHHCLGAPLARLEGEIALRRLATRFPDARLAVPPEALRRRASSIINGYVELPVVLRSAGSSASCRAS
ncbi:cytochrome P450 [Solihabitans fulvus]|uniref:Cytochrome P450 n=1 Tax=Solihabitans fulvus TaxID=1892852 RepID=A0A5B2XTR7_9PSEU|nr:cytochrome P450 [Solihabitans fulvus]KAA2267067.1 cytochrome P450 [Solihabitans fulvus]